MREGTVGVVVMAYGTPRTPDDILPYYTDIRRGRPPTDEQLADLTARYAALGGTSPLAARTDAQRDAIAAALESIAPGRFSVTLGLKHWTPRIEDGVAEAVARGCTSLIGVVLAPHYSTMSIGQYVGRMSAAASSHGVESTALQSWAVEPAYISFLANEVQHKLAKLPPGSEVAFTAHSLPRRVVSEGDPYPDELRSTAAAVADASRLDEAGVKWSVGFQSAGRTPEPWLGPDVLDLIDDAASRGVPGLLVSAVGFVADHLEVLYDLDIEAAAAATQKGIAFARTACVNDHPEVIMALARRIVELAP
jgi:ferrochelatase